ncbi:hypothetical protein BCR44DRAFT_72658 [Catenaria anguillulae PL171]|uniref:Uncharacterized protein n=1 Tax=Catenaria anguillulae PL171 TaxID=765915 RepID=A0A1Y2I190_9FUNG|nr:hypothetical protein BCR44DRAFT_72658 [Catenaria anguillulae PL171]
MNTMQSPRLSAASGSVNYRSPSLVPLLSPRLPPTSAPGSAHSRPDQQPSPRRRHHDYSLLDNGHDTTHHGNGEYSPATPSHVFGEGDNTDAQASPFTHSHSHSLSFPASGQVSTFRSPSLRATLPSSSAFAAPKSAPSLGHVLIAFLDSTAWGLVYAAVDAALSLALVALYLVSSSYVGLAGNSSHSPKDPDSLPYLPTYLIVFECIIAFLLILTFLPRLLLFYPTHSIWSRFMRPEVVLTLCSCLPVLILRGPWAWATPAYVYDGLTSSNWALVDHLIFAWPIRFLRLWWSLHRGLSLLASSPYVRFSLAASKVLDLISGIVCCMMACSSTLHIIEVKYSPALKPGNSLSFFDAFFFTFLIAVTIAYDAGVVPDAVFPRLLVIFTILLGIALVPYGIAQVIHVVNLQSKYDASYQHDPRQNHVLVVGSGASLETFTLRHFLSQFFSPGNASSITTKVVILVPHDPPERTAQVLREPAFRHRVQWIRGSVFSMDDLVRRAQARDAQACFVLARKYATSSHAVDADNVLRSMAIASATNSPIYVQCLLPENRGHFSHFSELVLCVDALKLAVLARSALCPGFRFLSFDSLVFDDPWNLPLTGLSVLAS